MEPTIPYQMAINNVARYISSSENMALLESSTPDNRAMNAFTAATVLGKAFCKDEMEVLTDIIASAKTYL